MRTYPCQGWFSKRYSSTDQITVISEEVGSTKFRANSLGQLYMEDVVWAGAIGVAKMVCSDTFGQFNMTLQDLLHQGLADCDASERKPKGEVHSMRYTVKFGGLSLV
jgi:hypothetical protein